MEAISGVGFVRRGFFKLEPTKIELNQEDINRMKNEIAEATGEDPQTLLHGAGGGAGAARDDEFDMENYDEEGGGIGERMTGAGMAGMTYYANQSDDPYITLGNESDSDIDDYKLTAEDILILSTRKEEEVSKVEIHVYDESDGNLWMHHDIILDEFPLCLSWTGVNPMRKTEQGNFVAVGTFNPNIEIFDADVVDILEPSVVLGGHVEKPRKGKKAKLKAGSHSSAVLSLDWNSKHGHVLASASADGTVKVWDVETAQCLTTLEHHKDKVNVARWNSAEETVLLTGSNDKDIYMVDARTCKAALTTRTDADIECLEWMPWETYTFLVSLENGLVTCHDARRLGEQPLFTLGAHDMNCSAIAMGRIPGMLITGSHDKTVKIWDIANGQPSLILQGPRKPLGAVFALSLCPDAPYVCAMGGSKGVLNAWDLSTTRQVVERFGERARELGILPAQRTAGDRDHDSDEDSA